MMVHICTYCIVEFYPLRALNCTLYIIRKYIHTVNTRGVSFLPSYQPFKSHHLVGSHKLQ